MSIWRVGLLEYGVYFVVIQRTPFIQPLEEFNLSGGLELAPRNFGTNSRIRGIDVALPRIFQPFLSTLWRGTLANIGR
jgi:hypothetical protein